uniref:PEST proteolytic signal-containing nuclear protein n=1 Tax=Astyanax mexicanus TaxID=7994 RepID=A0A3B1JE13_ASTMX
MTRESTPESESVETGLSGPEEKEGSAKSNTVSSSTGPGGGLGKRPAEGSSTAGDQRRKQAVPFKISKPSISTTSPILKKPAPISIKLGASVILCNCIGYCCDKSEPEEMPPEAKMRMKNIGRDTPTSAGPNSFNKGKQGSMTYLGYDEMYCRGHFAFI